ncbi:hypothetical protein GBZ48_17785 [Azospirillum melinis]|uniref:Uncharacterized protein n=1 Tax=Azospirillum melinis TaxID=328839 RepID=A0ABX2KBZ2_9PROT|nr:hypothetical protein [Azospirillum melinis]MBP2304606.1 hypothetical protein [Azospirillum melinis]NUB01128.1 hypothetical protein [Azospirillum melinis]
MSKRLELEALRADLAAVESIIANLDAEDFVAKLSFEARRDELLHEIKKIDHRADTLASVAIFFQGKPVLGSRAIDAEFASNAVAMYQDIVSKKLAVKETGGLAQRGPIPVRNASKLNIVDIVHGSFGFVLEEDDENGVPLFNSSLRDVVSEAGTVVEKFSSNNDEDFSRELEEIDQRLFSSVKKFYRHLHDNEASIRLVENDSERKIDKYGVERAYRRVMEADVSEDVVQIDGVLLGVTPISRRFDMRRIDVKDVITGKVGPLFSLEYLRRIEKDEQFIGRMWRATLNRKTVVRPGGRETHSYTLVSLDQI